MSEVVMAIGVLGTVIGISFAVWSIIDTRHKYGDRKRSASE